MAPPALHVVAWLLSMTMVASGIPMGYEYPAPEVPFIEGAQVSTTPAPDCVPGELQDNPYYTSLLDMGVPLCPSENQYDDYDSTDIPADQAKPIEDLPTYTEAPVEEYDEYDPNNIPEDQAAPATEGYNYPVPENPLTLPTKPTTIAPLPLPDCVPAAEEALGDNPYFLEQGVPFCPEDLPAYTEAPVAPVEIYEEEAAYEYDEYDPSDIPEDQAAPEEVTEGYNYPVPENPLVLPTRPTTTALPLPDCVAAGEEDLGDNPFFLEQGVPLCPEELPAYTEAPVEEYDEYDPSDIPEDQAAPEEDLPTYTEAPVEEYDEYDPSDIPEDQAAPEEVTEGYNYPVPENPLVLPTKPTTTALPLPDCVTMDDPLLETYQELGVELCPIADPVLEYDEYDPNDIPEDQAAPATEGYNYPVPENPLVLPTRPTTTPLPLPDCVTAGEEDLGDNPFFLEQGVPICPEELPAYTEYDEYDPSDIPEDQAAPVEDLPTYTEAPVEEYDEYDPNDIPEDQAAPATEGYNYPVPENPLVLPTRPTTTEAPLPTCVTELEDGAAEFIAQGVPLCPEELPAYTEAPVEEYDEYDPNDIPEDQAAPEEDLPTYTEAPVEEYDEYDPNDIPEDQAAPATEGYNYPVPENPLVLPSRARKAKVVVDKEEELTIGLTHLDTDSYDPGNYDHNSPDYIEEVEEEERTSDVTHQGRRTQQSGISLTGPGHVISFHVPAGHVKMVEEQRAVEEFGGERHADPFTNLLGGELIPPVLRKMKAGKKTKTGMVNTVEDEESSRDEVKPTGRFNKGRNHRNRNRKNKNRRNQASKQKQVKKEKNKSTTTTTSTTTTKRPRGGRKLSSRKTAKGRQNISVQAWLRRG